MTCIWDSLSFFNQYAYSKYYDISLFNWIISHMDKNYLWTVDWTFFIRESFPENFLRGCVLVRFCDRNAKMIKWNYNWNGNLLNGIKIINLWFHLDVNLIFIICWIAIIYAVVAKKMIVFVEILFCTYINLLQIIAK